MLPLTIVSSKESKSDLVETRNSCPVGSEDNALACRHCGPGSIPDVDTSEGLWSPSRIDGFSPSIPVPANSKGHRQASICASERLLGSVDHKSNDGDA